MQTVKLTAPLLAQSPSSLQNNLSEALSLMVVGMLVVFTALTLTALAIALLNFLDRRAEGAGEPAGAGAQPQSDQRRIAVIAAAAAVAVMGPGARVTSIERAGSGGTG